MGIIGLAQVGKTTLFRILTRARGSGLNSGRPQPHLGLARVPDARLDRLAELHDKQKVIHASVEYVDTPGSIIAFLRSGAQGAGMRELDALAHVLRLFPDDSAPPTGAIDLERDRESVELELILTDLGVIEKRLERLEKDLKKQKSPALEKEHHALRACSAALEKQIPLREAALEPETEHTLRGYAFLSLKPMLYVLNLGEKDAARTSVAEEFAAEAGLQQRPHTAVAAICGKVEAELAELSDVEAAEFLASYGLAESATTRLIRASYRLLGLISFFTIGDEECRAWTIRDGTTAWQAAGQVHSEIQKGFIRAEVVKFDDLVKAGSFSEARHRGLLGLQGKDYVVQDGDVVYFRHSG